VAIDEDDPVIDHAAARLLIERWPRRGADVSEVGLPQALGLIHDLVEPSQPQQLVARV
jgi:hypothetical protein